jgi:Holliday junction resolvase
MASTPEGLVKTKIKKLLNEYGALHFSPYMAGMGSAGVSDIIALYKGYYIAIEAKADETKKPTELQKKFLEQVRERGGLAYVIHKDNINSLKEILNGLS